MEPMSVRRAAWIAHVQSWRDSDLSQAGYCRRHTLNSKTFAAWIKRCNAASAQRPLTLVPVTVTPPTATGELLLRHASGWQLALPSSTEPAWLAGLLRGLV
ncbi:MAG: IS66 family insertion sequence element accessory protein TnpA [Alishewanella aestuarii]